MLTRLTFALLDERVKIGLLITEDLLSGQILSRAESIKVEREDEGSSVCCVRDA